MKKIKTKAPIDVEYLQEYFSSEEEIKFELMYYDSDIKGKTFFNYVSNLDINFGLNFYQTSQEERYELLSLYLTSNSLINCKELELALTYIILKHNQCDVEDLYSFTILTDEFCNKFIEEHSNLLTEVTSFIESLPLTTLSFVPELEDIVSKELDTYEVVEDPEILGKNIINLINNPFVFQLYEKENKVKKYYKHYSEEYIYDEKNLYAWMVDKDVPLLVFVQGIIAGVQPSK